jgi:uncharacterized repeat protein (TIGR04138 family)
MDDNAKFLDVVERICETDSRYDMDAYLFVREALDHTVKRLGRSKSGAGRRHVSGKELLDGIREHALRQFGPMALTVFKTWGIERTRDFGELVFSLVNSGLLGKTDEDRVEDFDDGYDFADAFAKPFLPRSQPRRRSPRRRPPRQGPADVVDPRPDR